MTGTINDNQAERAGAQPEPADAYGHAAILLVESLLHGLLARSVLSVAEAIEIVDVASDVKQDLGAELGETTATLDGSLALLGSIRLSLTHDLPTER